MCCLCRCKVESGMSSKTFYVALQCMHINAIRPVFELWNHRSTSLTSIPLDRVWSGSRSSKFLENAGNNVTY